MHRESYLRSRIPVPLVLLFVLNVFVVMALEVLILYPHPAELTEEWLSEYDSAYKNSTIVTRDERGTLRCWLIKLESGDYAMIPLRQHGLLTNRAKILTNQIATVSADAREQEITVKVGLHSSVVSVSRTPNPGYHTENAERYLSIIYHNSGNHSGTTAIYMALAAVLEGLELAIWQLIKQN